MSKQWPAISVYIENLGPFKELEVQLKPITIIIGKNNTGKSFLLYLLWSFFSTLPNFEQWNKVLSKRRFDLYIKSVYESLPSGEININQLKQAILDIIDSFPDAIKPNLQKRIEKTFGTSVNDLLYDSSKDGILEMHTEDVKIETVFKSDGNIELNIKFNETELRRYISRVIEKLKIIKTNKKKTLLALEDSKEMFEISGRSDLTNFLFELAERFMLGSLVSLPAFLGESLSWFIVDGRAGITRSFLKPYIPPEIYDYIPLPDAQYIRLYFKLAEELYNKKISTSDIKDILRELGIKEIRAEPYGGVYKIYVTTLHGRTLPFERTPSGVRESLLLILSIQSLSNGETASSLFVEEPESHLHPKAIIKLAELLLKRTSTVLYLFITTHSDYLIYAINNEILKIRPEERLSIVKLISALLLRNECTQYGCYSVAEEIHVTPDEGISEDEFTKIVEELAEERARYVQKDLSFR